MRPPFLTLTRLFLALSRLVLPSASILTLIVAAVLD